MYSVIIIESTMLKGFSKIDQSTYLVLLFFTYYYYFLIVIILINSFIFL